MLFLNFQRLIIVPKPRIFSSSVRSFRSKLSEKYYILPEKNSSLIIAPNVEWNQISTGSNKLRRNIHTSIATFYGVKGIQESISTLQMKKRPLRKKRSITEDEEQTLPGYWNVKSMATAEEYNLEGLMDGLNRQDLYLPKNISTSSKCVDPMFTLENISDVIKYKNSSSSYR